MNRLWKLVNDRVNYLSPTKKSVGWGQDRVDSPRARAAGVVDGRRTRA